MKREGRGSVEKLVWNGNAVDGCELSPSHEQPENFVSNLRWGARTAGAIPDSSLSPAVGVAGCSHHPDFF